ncbi:MAG: chloride channel protein [Coriobacteriia bacterium]|nr:chloride channel protein [Coriobacteriia bacterium]
MNLSHSAKQYGEVAILSAIAIVIGAAIGGLDAVFGHVLIYVSNLRTAHPWWLIPILPFAGLVIAYMYNYAGKDCYRAMALVFEAGHGERDNLPLRLIPLVIVSTWITHLFGASAGREGVGMQIGGVIGNRVGKMVPIKNAPKILLLAGMAAGFSGLFQTPFAAFFFALEVLTAGRLEYDALVPIFVGSFVGDLVAARLGMPKFAMPLQISFQLTWMFAAKCVLLGIVFGVVGRLFAESLERTRNYFRSFFFEKPFKQIFSVGIVVAVLSLLLFSGRYSGLGENLIVDAFQGHAYYYDWILKLFLTIISLAAGFRGGEVMPLFVIGAALGAVLAPYFGVPLVLAVALGYVAVFGAGTNTMLAPMFAGAEIFGFHYLPLFFIVCLIAYFFNGNKSIYHLQKHEML